MTTLTIVARILAKEGKSTLVKEALLKLIAPTRAEKGCIDYILHQDNQNPNLFLFYETWENHDLWQAHMQTPHILEYLKVTEGAIEDFTVHEMTLIG